MIKPKVKSEQRNSYTAFKISLLARGINHISLPLPSEKKYYSQVCQVTGKTTNHGKQGFSTNIKTKEDFCLTCKKKRYFLAEEVQMEHRSNSLQGSYSYHKQKNGLL